MNKGDCMKKLFSFRIDVELLKRVKLLAKKNKKHITYPDNISGVINTALNEYLNKNK